MIFERKVRFDANKIWDVWKADFLILFLKLEDVATDTKCITKRATRYTIHTKAQKSIPLLTVASHILEAKKGNKNNFALAPG